MTKIDYDHWKGAQIGDIQTEIVNEQFELQIIAMLKPNLSLDGNQYCFTYGEVPNDCIQGFGDTAIQAARDFKKNFYQEKATLCKHQSKK